MEQIVCKKCGRQLDVTNFKRTRWGTYSCVCNECATKARVETMRKNKAAIADLNERQNKENRILRLSDFSPRELMEELARRGYEGKLKFVEVHEIDICDF